MKQHPKAVRAFAVIGSPLTVAFATSLPSGARRLGGYATKSCAITLLSRGEIGAEGLSIGGGSKTDVEAVSDTKLR